MRHIPRPATGEFPAYASMYIDLLPHDGNLLQHLQDNFEMVKKLVHLLSPAQLLFRYAPGKWTIKEVLVHIIDDERIYAYRGLRFARQDKTPLPGFEQDDYVLSSGANERDIDNIMEEYAAVRKATITLLNGLPGDAFTREGTANNNKVSVRALAYHIAGHELHHITIIREKYLGAERA
jgi:uncharacterized damage-inducible protein DinB